MHNIPSRSRQMIPSMPGKESLITHSRSQFETQNRVVKRDRAAKMRTGGLSQVRRSVGFVPFGSFAVERRRRDFEIRRRHPHIAVAQLDRMLDCVPFHILKRPNVVRHIGGRHGTRRVGGVQRRGHLRGRALQASAARCQTRNLRRQHRGRYFTARIHHDHVADHVLEFAHVARPVIADNRRCGVTGKAVCLTSAPMEQISGIT